MSVNQTSEQSIVLVREPASETCPRCGGSGLRSYPVLSEAGWVKAVKCQRRLRSASREPWNLPGLEVSAHVTATPVAGVLHPDTRVLHSDSGSYRHMASNLLWHAAPCAAVFGYLSDGGGWGEPLRRDADPVKDSVPDGYVSIAGPVAARRARLAAHQGGAE